ncbi:glutathione S-transferase T3-like [Salvia hispanica]|uniref:glutathione S-transferase T3-like n=1 Tax=Salvia hispanica TaxID=49212 RepID=UPI0020091C7E|nr:glutathione S-transferase T3-like [Salvia hispanica]
MFNSLAGSSTPSTQRSATPAPYQAPHFDLDAYYRPPPPRSTQGLSQIRVNFPEEHAPEYFPIGGSASRDAEEEQGEEEEEDEDLGRHLYIGKETLALYTTWLTVSYDPIVGNQQNRKCFWEKVTELYEESKPKGIPLRNVKMLRSHWDQCNRDVKNFCTIYRGEAEHYQSGASGADNMRAAMRVFKDDVIKDFKHINVWTLVRDKER